MGRAREILPSPLLSLSAFFEATRRDYYDLLAPVSRSAQWEPWLLYFLRGVAHQAIDALVSHRVLRQTDDARRGRVYCAQALLDILDEPADMAQAGKAGR